MGDAGSMKRHLADCQTCGTAVMKSYRLNKTRLSQPIYCSVACEKTSKRSRALKRRTTHFWTKTNPVSSHECWEWIGFKDGNGYGRYGRILAHRIAYELTLGEIPRGMAVCHKCDNPGCVNPDHLWIGTQADNVRDMLAKGRDRRGPPRRGETSNKAKLTSNQVREILQSTETLRTLADRYGVSGTAIHYIRHKRNWRHLSEAQNVSQA